MQKSCGVRMLSLRLTLYLWCLVVGYCLSQDARANTCYIEGNHLIQRSTITKNVGEEVNLTCEACTTVRNRNVSFAWSHNGVNVATGANYGCSSFYWPYCGEGHRYCHSSFRLSPIRVSHRGDYTCTASCDDHQTASTTYIIQVNGFCDYTTCSPYNGRCVKEPNGTLYVCQCNYHWSGDDCTSGPCDRMTCYNGGTCDNYAEDYESRCKCPPGWTGSLCQIRANQNSSSNQGREFIFAFPENYKKTTLGPKLTILSTTPNTTSIQVTIPGINFTQVTDLAPNSTQSIQLPASATVKDTMRNLKTVLIEASDDIIVYGMGDNHVASNDGFLALPVPALGLEYRVVGALARPRDLYRSQFIVSGTEDNTTININFRKEMMFEGKLLSPRQELIFTLNRLESVQFQSTSDLTVTWVRSTKPISIMSGSRCGFIMTPSLQGRKSCEYMITQLPPVTSWGRKFIISPLLKTPGTETVVRIISNEAENHVSVSTGLGGISIQYPYYPYDFALDSPTPITLIASKPVLVVLYTSYTSTECSKPGKTCKGDGKFGVTMTYATPMEMFYSEAYFDTEQLLPGYNYHLNVITECANKNTMYLNDYLFAENVQGTMRNNMCSFNLELPLRRFRLWSLDNNASFVAHLTGFRKGAAFTIPIGARFVSPDGANTIVTHSTTGKEFVFAFMGSANALVFDKGPKVILIADKDTEHDTHVTIKTADLTTEVAIPTGESRIIELPTSVLAIESRIPRPDAAVHVTASHPITVYGLNDAYPHDDDPRSDGFRVLSTDRLGMEYYTISSYDQGSYSGQRAQFIIIGIEDNTDISIHAADALWVDGSLAYGGTTKHVTIHRMGTIFFVSNGDQIGTQVTSTKPISILAGHDCGGPRPCEHQIEHLVPKTTWGRHFVLPKFPGYVDGSYQTFIQGGTELEPYDIEQVFIGEKGYRHFDPDNNETTSWSSFVTTNPAMVIAIIDHRGLTSCQPSCPIGAASTSVMTIIPPLTPLEGNVAFRHVDIRNANNTYNYATIISECENMDLLILNGKTLRHWGTHKHFDDKRFCVGTVELEQDQVYYMNAIASNVTVSAVAYGFSGDASFAYPLL